MKPDFKLMAQKARILMWRHVKATPGGWADNYRKEFDALALVEKPFSNVSRR